MVAIAHKITFQKWIVNKSAVTSGQIAILRALYHKAKAATTNTGASHQAQRTPRSTWAGCGSGAGSAGVLVGSGEMAVGGGEAAVGAAVAVGVGCSVGATVGAADVIIRDGIVSIRVNVYACPPVSYRN